MKGVHVEDCETDSYTKTIEVAEAYSQSYLDGFNRSGSRNDKFFDLILLFVVFGVGLCLGVIVSLHGIH